MGGQNVCKGSCQIYQDVNTIQYDTQNMTSCMDSCATMDKCVGIVFDSTLSNGFENCYLQNTASTISDKASATFAALIGSSIPSSSSSFVPGNSNSSSSSSSDNRGSKAWIAGPVVGGLAGLAIIARAMLLWRCRKNQNAAKGTEKHQGVQYDTAPSHSPELSQTGCHSAQPAAGMGRPEVEGHATRNELPGTTKYSHRTGEGEVHEAP